MRRNVIIIKRSESALEALLDNANADKAALQAEIDGLDGQITTLNADKAALQSQIDDLNSQVATLTATNASQAGQISSLTSNNAALTTANANQASQISSLTSNNAALVQKFPFTGHWWNGLTGTNERHWYLSQSGDTITGNYTSKDLFGTIFAFNIVICTVSATNLLGASGTMIQTAPTAGATQNFSFAANSNRTQLSYANGNYTKV